jgi:small subunit ribosomal protein S17
MAEEDKNQVEASDEAADEAVEPTEEAAEPEAAAEQPEAEPQTSEEQAGEAEAEDLDPKTRRRLERSRASGPPGPVRTPEERATGRASKRSASAERRRRYRTAQRAKRGEAGSGTPPAAREPGPKKVRRGTVVSAGGDKTITVEIAVVRRHPTYEKVVRRTSRLHAHDETNQAQEGDVVRVVESRPLSRTKRWRLLEVLEKAR